MAPMLSSSFSNIPVFARDEAFGCTMDYVEDPSLVKVNLGAGVYRDEDGRPWVLPSVRRAESILLEDETLDHEYLPIIGYAPFIAAAQKLVFGDDVSPTFLRRTASIQTISGTGANHTAARFLESSLAPKRIWMPDPTWPNHNIIWDLVSPDIEQRYYPYHDPNTNSLDFANMLKTLDDDARPGDIILLHACAHNPTGLDLSPTQWQAILSLCTSKSLFPLFDAAYLGFATGDPSTDAWAIRLFANAEPALEFAVAQSFSKNFGLYSERVGALHMVTRSAEARERSLGLLSHIQRGEISNPPAFGARLVTLVLGDPNAKKRWEGELRVMSGRIRGVRQALYDELMALGTPGEWRHVVEQVGMFSYTGLSAAIVDRLKAEFHIHMLRSGRASISGLNSSNIPYVARSIDICVRQALDPSPFPPTMSQSFTEVTQEVVPASATKHTPDYDQVEDDDDEFDVDEGIYADLAMLVAQHASRRAWFDIPHAHATYADERNLVANVRDVGLVSA